MASLGDSLREEREARNISLEEIASATKIVPRYLEALETDRLDLMPGGFFVRAIIRSYAQAVGLDPDEVVERYKAAGMLEPPEPSRGIFSRRAAPAPVLADQAPAVAPPVPVEAPIPAVEIPASMERPEPGVLFEEAAAKPGRPLMTRQQMRVWTWRGLAALGIVLVALILWSPWHRHPAPIGRGPVTVRTQLPAANPAAKPAEKTVKPTEAAKPPEKTPTETGRQAAQAVSKTAAEAPPAVAGPPAPKPEAAVPPRPAERSGRASRSRSSSTPRRRSRFTPTGRSGSAGSSRSAPRPGPRPTRRSSSIPATPADSRSS